MKLKLKNWGSLTGEWDFGPLVLVTGPHESGKSTLMAALQFALLGSVPSLGKDALVRFIGPKEAEATVDVSLDTGIAITRVLSVPNKKPSVATSCFTGERRLIGKVAEGWLGQFDLRPHFLDMSLLKGMKGDERRQALMSLLPTDQSDAADQMIAVGKAFLLAQHSVSGWDEATTDKARAELWAKLPPKVQAKWAEMEDVLLHNIEAGMAKVKERANELEREKQTREKVASELLGAATMPAEDLALVDELPALEAQEHKLLQSIADARSRMASAATSRREFELISARRNEVETEVFALTEKLKRRDDVEAKVAQQEQHVVVLTGSRPDFKSVAEEFRTTNGTVIAAENALQAAMNKAMDLFQKWQAMSKGETPCQYIGVCNGDLSAYHADIAAEKDALANQQAAIKAEVVQRKATLGAAKERLAALQKQLDDGQAKERAWHEGFTAATISLNQSQMELATYAEAAHKLAGLNSELSRLVSVPTPVEQSHDEDEALVVASEMQRQTVVEKLSRGRRASATVANVQTVNPVDYERPIAIWKGLHKALGRAFATWQEQEVAPCSAEISAALNAMGVAGTVEIVADGKAMDVRLRQRGAVVSLDALSGSAWLRLCVAIQATLLDEAQRIMTSEAAEMSHDCLASVMAWASQQPWKLFMVSTWAKPTVGNNLWTTIELAEPTREVIGHA